MIENSEPASLPAGIDPNRPLKTPRLILRRWREEDKEPFFALNSDPEVMRHFPSPTTREQSDSLASYFNSLFDELGFSAFSVEEYASGQFIGFVGIWPADEFPGSVEAGWRLSHTFWGKGYATEAARAAIVDYFDQGFGDEILSYTANTNLPSKRVMERLGMTHEPSRDFSILASRQSTR